MSLGLTQGELAKRADVTRWVIWGAENGRIPRFAAQAKIAAALGREQFELWPLLDPEPEAVNA